MFSYLIKLEIKYYPPILLYHHPLSNISFSSDSFCVWSPPYSSCRSSYGIVSNGISYYLTPVFDTYDTVGVYYVGKIATEPRGVRLIFRVLMRGQRQEHGRKNNDLASLNNRIENEKMRKSDKRKRLGKENLKIFYGLTDDISFKYICQDVIH